MPNIEVACMIRLPYPIALSWRSGDMYQPAKLTRENGDTVTISLVSKEPDNPPESIVDRTHDDHRKSDNHYFVTKIELLEVFAIFCGASELDLTRLRANHAREDNAYVARDRFQQEPIIEERIYRRVLEAINRVLYIVREEHGQFWVHPLSSPFPNLLYESGAQWRESGGEWQRLVAGPTSANMGVIVVGASDCYLRPQDWKNVNKKASDCRPVRAEIELLNEAQERHYNHDAKMAILFLSLAIESASERFVTESLDGVLPEKSIKHVKNQSLKSLLENWVLPLGRTKSLRLEAEWEDIQTIRKRRNKSAHSSEAAACKELSDGEWFRLSKSTARFIAKTAAIKEPIVTHHVDHAGTAGPGVLRQHLEDWSSG